MLDIKVEMINLNVSNNTIVGLFNSELYYRNNQNSFDLDYEFFPNENSNGYNSNSFTAGLLYANSIWLNAPSYSVPGWEKPVPKLYFGK